MKRVAFITARSGSKGLPDKNIIDLCGKPLMAYSIEAAKESNMFDRVIVSTDSEKYGEIAVEYGAEVMYRGERLSDDKATSFMVIEDLLMRIEQQYDYFALLQPTSPLRNCLHLTEAINLFDANIDKYDFLASVKEAEHATSLIRPIEEDLSMKNFDLDYSNYRRQNTKEYTPNGAIFLAKGDAYLKQKHFFGPKSIAYIMDKRSSVDIDDYIDYELARCILMEGK